MNALVIDTDVASLSIKRRLPPRLHARLAASLVCVSFVTVGELIRWARLHSWGPRPRRELSMWMRESFKLGYDDEIARVWGELSAASTQRGRTSPANDTWIAAVCLVEGLPLATRNVKDFAPFAEHHGLVLVTE
jgi:predicted nucleic acid-binding protein